MQQSEPHALEVTRWQTQRVRLSACVSFVVAGKSLSKCSMSVLLSSAYRHSGTYWPKNRKNVRTQQRKRRLRTRAHKRRLLVLSNASRALQVNVATHRVPKIRFTYISAVPFHIPIDVWVDSEVAQPAVKNGNKAHSKNMIMPLNVPLGNTGLDDSSLRVGLNTNVKGVGHYGS
eukprot:3674768-Amphidinium_carterae.1